MEENIELVEGTTENTVEQPVEEVVVPEKIYSEEELNAKLDAILPKKLNRREEKIRKEYEQKYGELENILMAGLNVNSIEEATQNLKEFYSNKGVTVPQYNNHYNDREERILADAEARDIIDSSSLAEIKEELDTIAAKGYDNMTSRDKVMFQKLNDYYKNESARKELASAGISEENLQDKDFMEFADKLNPNMSMKDKYEMYNQYRPKPMVEPIGSMKNITPEKVIKEYYTPEEVRNLSSKELDDPVVMEAVQKSMTKWYKEHIQ